MKIANKIKLFQEQYDQYDYIKLRICNIGYRISNRVPCSSQLSRIIKSVFLEAKVQN